VTLHVTSAKEVVFFFQFDMADYSVSRITSKLWMNFHEIFGKFLKFFGLATIRNNRLGFGVILAFSTSYNIAKHGTASKCVIILRCSHEMAPVIYIA